LEKAIFSCRAVKSPGEIQIMKEACRISSLAHIENMKKCKPGLYEYQLESNFNQFCSWHGCRAQAYRGIFGSGYNGAILHYSDNSKQLVDGELIVVDAGSENLCYASDITRTFPVSGKFTEPQNLIYSIVLHAQKQLICQVKPGVEFKSLSTDSTKYLLQGLITSGFVTCTLEEAIAKDVVRLFMPHGLGHLLGLDVHDVSVYPRTPLIAGMVITIEPGIYFNHALIDKWTKDPEKSKLINVEKVVSFRNFGGVRIEDDVLVTEQGMECLTDLVPKEIDQIEKLMEGNNKVQ